ncbi:MAG: hypothetical protein C0507_24860 [Cyanobacteria bacterium PR.3.49]|nr:hypothetical protein [Cyanobacteria bacterium PR.3.49]
MTTADNRDEIAAALACVFAVMKSRAIDPRQSEPQSDSNWATASRLEGVGEVGLREKPAGQSGTRSRWWSGRSMLSLLMALSCGLLFGSAALAADESTSDESNSQENFPPLAALPVPAFDRRTATSQSFAAPYPVSQIIPSRSGQVIRVLLSRGSKAPEIAMIDGATVINLATMTPAYKIAAGSRFQVHLENRRLAFQGADYYSVAQAPAGSAIRQVVAMTPRSFNSNAPSVNKFSLLFDLPQSPKSTADAGATLPAAPKGGIKPYGYLVVSNAKEGLLSYNGRVYRGAIWLKPVSSGADVSFQAINIVDLEDYLLSVVPSEMPTVWHKEAVKAQSIAARSYAVANYWKNEKDSYDLKDTTDDQVYLGVESETTAGNQACDETVGIVLKHNQKVISAFFHSTSGGATEAGENVWGKEIPYVQSVLDYDDNSPHFAWQRRFNIDQAEKAFGLKTGTLLSIQPFWKVSTNRVKNAAVVSTGNTTVLSGERLRQLFKLPSSIFNVSFEDGSYIFAGRGFGHGLGMSQYGARTLAESGYNAAQILSYYYRDVSVEYLNRAPGI